MSSSGGRSDSGNEDHFDANQAQSDADRQHFDVEGDSSTVMEENESGTAVHLVGLI
jgi:hypothetical protein